MATQNHGRLTKRTVEAIEAPASGALLVWDDDVRGFYVRVTRDTEKSGAEKVTPRYTYYFYGRTKRGRQGRLSIGRHGDITADKAREVAKRYAGVIANDGDPFEDREKGKLAEVERRDAPTVNELCDIYLEEYARIEKRPLSVRDDESMIGDLEEPPPELGKKKREGIIRPKLGRRRVAEILTADIRKMKNEMRDTPYRANRVLALLSKMFALAIERKMRPDNPAHGIERFPEEKRERYLKAEELIRLTQLLEKHHLPRDADGGLTYPNPISAGVVQLLLLTGARRGEALGATWSQFDLKEGVWTKPSAHTKQKKEHKVPLSPAALDVLAKMRKRAEDRARGRIPKPDLSQVYVFPGKAEGEPLTDIHKFWASICTAAKLKAVRLHDLRHTYASLLVSSGHSLPLIGALLGHTQPGTTHRYAHVSDNPMRAATGLVADLLAELAKKKPAEVTILEERGQPMSDAQQDDAVDAEIERMREDVRLLYFRRLLKMLGEDEQHQRDPLAPWLAWDICRVMKIDPPDWVTAAFDRLAASIAGLVADPPKKDVAGAVGRALGFGAIKKGENWFRDVHDTQSNYQLLAEYLTHRREGLSRTAACQRIADKRDMTKRSVEHRLTRQEKPKAADFAQLDRLVNNPLSMQLLALFDGAPPEGAFGHKPKVVIV